MKERITVRVVVHAPLQKVWSSWTEPEHIMKWCHASADWHAPHATNDLRVGGVFTTRMESVDGTIGFDFSGTYTEVIPQEKISYSMSDGRMVDITFISKEGVCEVTEIFDPEDENTPLLQQEGWQSILNTFKNYTESL